MANQEKNSTGLKRYFLLAAAFFMVALIIIELVIGNLFIADISAALEEQRKEEFTVSWQKFLEQRKKIHISKVTGYVWWNEAAKAIIDEDIQKIHNDIFGGDASLRQEYDVFIAAGKKGRLLYGIVDGKNSYHLGPQFAGYREPALEKHFLSLTDANLKSLYKEYVQQILINKNKETLEPVVWHYITEYNGQPRLLTISNVCQNEGYPVAQGFVLFGKSMESLTSLAGDIIPAKIKLHKSLPKDAYLVVEETGVDNEKWYVSFEPNLLIADNARTTLYFLVASQVVVSAALFFFIAIGFTKKYTEDLQAKIDERTVELQRANTKLQSHQKSLQHELQLAQAIQRNMMPQTDRINGSLEIASMYIPVAGLGGDLYDIFPFDDGKVGVLLADVSGHGVPAALIAMMAKLSFGRHVSPHTPPGQTLNAVNKEMKKYLALGDYLTAAYLIIDTHKGRLHWALGGHHPLFFYNSQTGEIDRLSGKGTIIGLIPNLKYADYERPINPGDKIYMYSDGFIEEQNAEGIMFGDERMIHILVENGTETVNVVKNKLIQELYSFKGDELNADDLTLVAVEYKG